MGRPKFETGAPTDRAPTRAITWAQPASQAGRPFRRSGGAFRGLRHVGGRAHGGPPGSALDARSDRGEHRLRSPPQSVVRSRRAGDGTSTENVGPFVGRTQAPNTILLHVRPRGVVSHGGEAVGQHAAPPTRRPAIYPRQRTLTAAGGVTQGAWCSVRSPHASHRGPTRRETMRGPPERIVQACEDERSPCLRSPPWPSS